MEGCIFEGPAWDSHSNCLFFTSISRELFKLGEDGCVQVIGNETNGIIGMCALKNGEMICGQTYTHSILRFNSKEFDLSARQVIATVPYLNQPNDICSGANGCIYFTDPDFKTKSKSGVYMLSAHGEVRKVVDDMPVPNGIAVSADQKVLYVGDSLEKTWRCFDINDDGTLSNGRVFFQPHKVDEHRIKNKLIDWSGNPDGMTVDQHGNLYLTDKGGIWVVSQRSEVLGFIRVPGMCTNVAFGGKNGNYLFITCCGKVYKLKMRVAGSGLDA